RPAWRPVPGAGRADVRRAPPATAAPGREVACARPGRRGSNAVSGAPRVGVRRRAARTWAARSWSSGYDRAAAARPRFRCGRTTSACPPRHAGARAHDGAVSDNRSELVQPDLTSRPERTPPGGAPGRDLKPRSRDVTDGLEKTAARGMLRAVGMGDDDWEKPQIGVASSWNEITPCNLSLDRLAKAVKDGVHAGGGYPLEFGTISVSDGISMGHEGMHFSLVSREIIADSVETVMMAERLDGSVLLAGCDKSLPGMLMAAARLDLASVFLYAGSIMPGNVDGRDVTIIDAFEAVGACIK